MAKLMAIIVIILIVFICLVLILPELNQQTKNVEGVFDRVEYVGDGYSNTVIYFRDGSTFVIEDRHTPVPFSRGTKIRITYFTLPNGNANGRKDLKIEKID